MIHFSYLHYCSLFAHGKARKIFCCAMGAALQPALFLLFPYSLLKPWRLFFRPALLKFLKYIQYLQRIFALHGKKHLANPCT